MSDVTRASSERAPDESGELSRLRTRAALDRTLLAWIRTAFALQGFGFALATYVAKWISSGALRDVRPSLPINLGLTLVAAGVLSVLAGTVEYRRSLHTLGLVSHVPRLSLVFILASLMVAIGALVFVGPLLKVHPS